MKSGLANKMRDWMRGTRRPFAPKDVAAGIGIPPGPERERVARVMQNFLDRGEVEKLSKGTYRYNHAWRPKIKGKYLKRLYRAMFVSGSFTTGEIAALAGCSKSHAHKTIARLRSQGHAEQIGQKKGPDRCSIEHVYRVRDRTRFRGEVME